MHIHPWFTCSLLAEAKLGSRDVAEEEQAKREREENGGGGRHGLVFCRRNGERVVKGSAELGGYL